MSLVHGNILRRYPTGRAVGQLYLIHAVAFADDGDGCAVVQAADDVALSAVRCAQVEAGAAGSDGAGADGIGGVVLGDDGLGRALEADFKGHGNSSRLFDCPHSIHDRGGFGKKNLPRQLPGEK